MELKHSFKNKIITSLGGSFVHDQVFYIIQPVDSIRGERTPDNFGSSQSFNLTVSFPIEVVPGWDMQVNLLGMYNMFSYTFLEVPTSVNQASGRLNASNTFNFGHGWTGELTGWMQTPRRNFSQEITWRGSLDIGLQKTLGSSLKAKLSLQDVFHTNNWRGIIDTPNYTNKVYLHFDTRVLMLNFIYNFGNQKLKGARQHKTGSEDERQRTN